MLFNIIFFLMVCNLTVLQSLGSASESESGKSTPLTMPPASGLSSAQSSMVAGPGLQSLGTSGPVLPKKRTPLTVLLPGGQTPRSQSSSPGTPHSSRRLSGQSVLPYYHKYYMDATAELDFITSSPRRVAQIIRQNSPHVLSRSSSPKIEEKKQAKMDNQHHGSSSSYDDKIAAMQISGALKGSENSKREEKMQASEKGQHQSTQQKQEAHVNTSCKNAKLYAFGAFASLVAVSGWVVAIYFFKKGCS